MKVINWNDQKNAILKEKRNISFEELAFIITSGEFLGIVENQNYPNQKMYILNIDEYAVVVPFQETEDEIFLKTAYPSRKFTKLYGLRK